ncbi:uncharacterized protein VTP21DRAFT_3895 [Calcarisporiella thermophila]|uniref:uncharacterized protein n=1 Tax=Calcarisporiella thermophila TaxID=911321 RepID=UPI00374309E0
MSNLAANCIFCKIIRKEIPSHKLYETELTYAFLDINPLSEGHALVIPKYCAEFVHQVPDEHLADLLPVAKKIALAIGADNFNLLQNNGRKAHQFVPHVHFHIIPKPNEKEGLGISWPQQTPTKESLSDVAKKISERIEKL